jgi:hypothetical protein
MLRRLFVHRSLAWCRAPLLGLAASFCGDGATAPQIAAGTPLELVTVGLPILDPAREGRYEAWVIDGAGRSFSAGRFNPTDAVTLVSPAGDVRAVEITVEPPGDTDDRPSEQRLLRGTFRERNADLTIIGTVTQGDLPLREAPGTFTMFSPSDNSWAGYPSHEESGIWLFNMRPRETPQNDTWVRLTQLQRGWTYEGWMVRDLGAPDAIWLSYGKFVPDQTGAVNARDDTGWGPFSGVLDFRTSGEEEFPGDDWISNPLNFPFPSALTLPLNLRERMPNGASRWTHVITIEPASDRGEPIGSERPFFMRPYRDPFGDGAPGVPHAVTFHREAVPHGRVDVR